MKAHLSNGNAPSPEMFPIPPDALRAWHHLFLCLLFWSPEDMNSSLGNAKKCFKFLRKAYRDIMKNPNAKDLEETEAVLPKHLLGIITSRVLADFTGSQPDLLESYWEYFGQLVSEVTEYPFSQVTCPKCD